MRIKPLALVLDDEELFRSMMEKVLQRLGFTVKTVESIEAFKAAEAELEPELFLLDLHIGEHSGLDLVQSLRAKYPEVPIIVISGDKDPAVVSHALEIGANDFILKPFSRALLAAKLGQVIRTEEISDVEKLVETDERSIFEAKVKFDAAVVGVDELGFSLISRHLLPKGAVVRLGGSLVQEIGGVPDCMVCVALTAVAAGGAGYEIHAEFEGASAEFLQSVRRWLANQGSAKAA